MIDSYIYHEAGHCVMCCLQKRRFTYVTIDSEYLKDGEGGRFVQKSQSMINWEDVEKNILITQAGPIAEFYRDNSWKRYIFETQTADMMDCLNQLNPFMKEVEQRIKYLSYLYDCAVSILQHPLNKAYVKNVAEVLENEKTLTYSQVRLIMKATRIEMDEKHGIERYLIKRILEKQRKE